MAIKLDPEMIQTKTSIKIKDIDYTNKRAKLRITRSKAKSRDSRDDIISRESQQKDEEGEDDYYEEMQMRSKLKPGKKSIKKKAQDASNIEDKVETEGKMSPLNKTMSSFGKNLRSSNLSKSRALDAEQSSKPRLDSNASMLPSINVPGVREIYFEMGNSPSALHNQRLKQSSLVHEPSKGALSIMNVTFNEGALLKQRIDNSKGRGSGT